MPNSEHNPPPPDAPRISPQPIPPQGQTQYQQGVPPQYQQQFQQGVPPQYQQQFQQGVPPQYQQGVPPQYQQQFQQGVPPQYQQQFQQGVPPQYQQGVQPQYQQQFQQGLPPQDPPLFSHRIPRMFLPEADPCAPPPPPVPAPPAAKPGLRGIWANQEKCDTSEWNKFYFFFRQVSQHMASLRLGSLKWIAGGYLILYVLFLILVFIVSFHVEKIDPPELFRSFAVTASLIQLAVLAVIPTVMVGQAFSVREKKSGFLMSNAKEPPLLSHLIEYTTGDRLVEGVVQSLIYVYGRLFLFTLPALIVSCVLLAVFGPWTLGYVYIFLLTSMLFPVFIVMQSLCVRLDTLLLLLLTGVLLVFNCSALLNRHEAEIGIFGVFVFMTAAWAVCMTYLPLAAADTLEYGIGKNARRIRLFQLGIVLASLLVFVFLTLTWKKKSDMDFFEGLVLPALWCFAGVAGMLASSLAPASFRARNSFRLRLRKTKHRMLFRFFDPTSPGSILPVCLLEAAVLILYAVFATEPGTSGFWTGDENRAQRNLFLIVILCFSAIHFALVFMQRIRRRSRHEKPAWRMHPMFSLMFFVFLIAVSLPSAFFSGFRFIPPGFFIVSCLCLLLPTLREESELRKEKTDATRGAEGTAS